MISNKSKSIILLGGIMLSSAAFTIGTNNNNYPKNTAVYAINKNASENEVSKITNTAIINEVKDNNVNEESTNEEEGSNVDTNVAANSINTTDVSEENFVERDSSDEKISTVDNSVAVNNSNVNTSNSNNNVVDSKDEKVENVEISDEVSNTEKTDVDNSITESDIENNDKIESDTNNNESKVDLDNNNDEDNNVDSDTNNNIIASETQDNEIEDSNVNTDIAIAESTITCPELSEAPTFKVNDGINTNGIGDSVYEHLKDLGWTAVDENTIKINDDRLQFKNMNGQGDVDSIITITADFAENDKYVLYLLKLMIGDKSISTATPSDSDIYSGNFDDKYYDNFENLVRRIANGTGTIKYSNRNIRVQYDGNWDYTITVTFYNYTDGNASNVTTPSINGNINILN